MAKNIVPSSRTLFPSIYKYPFSFFPELFEEIENDMVENFTTVPSGLTVYEDEANLYVEAALPGLQSADIEVTLDKGVLWIRGEKKETEADKKKKYYRKASFNYSYRVLLPGEINETQEPKATYKDGIMTVSFSKSTGGKPKKINIK